MKGKEILPNLFIGSKRVAQNREWLDLNNIKYILNTSREVGNFFDQDFVYKRYILKDLSQNSKIFCRILVQDSTDEVLKEHFEGALEFIHQGRNLQNGGVLVHCSEGKSRSVSFTIAYLMKHENYNLKNAVEHVVAKHPTIRINDGFKRQLMDFEASLGKPPSFSFFNSRRSSKVWYLHQSILTFL
jgi:protein-tyrosine phosphatase